MALVNAASSIADATGSSGSSFQKVPTSALRRKDASSKWKFVGRAARVSVALDAVRHDLENESERTRLLKEVTRSAATQRAVKRFDSKGYLDKRRITLESENDAFGSPPASPRSSLEKRHSQHKQAKTGAKKAPIHREIVEETICREVQDGMNLSQLLAASSRNVDEMKSKVKADEGKAERQRRRNADWSWPQNEEVQIADEGVNVPKMSEASRGEASTVKFVQETVNFEELDALEELIQSNDGFQGLRKVFERRFEYHPRMKLLSDTVLSDAEALQSALIGDVPLSSESHRHPQADKTTAFAVTDVHRHPLALSHGKSFHGHRSTASIASISSIQANVSHLTKSKSMSAAMIEQSMRGKGGMHPLTVSPLSRSQRRGNSDIF